MTHKIYARKTKRFFTKSSKKLESIIKKVSILSADSLSSFEEPPSFRNVEDKNLPGVMNAFDLFQAYTSSIIHKKIIYSR